MRLFRPCYFLLLVLLLLIAPVHAAERELSVSLWLSQGQTDWQHNAAVLNPIWGNPTSELRYEKIDSRVLEVAFTQPFNNSDLYIAMGGGVIDRGVLVDDDYVSASGATYFGASTSGAHRISSTYSDITGSGLFYLNAEYHPALLRVALGRVPLQGYVGLQYWKEEYVAQGIQQIECTDPTASNGRTFCNPVGFSGYNDQVVITNKLIWTSWYLGGKLRLPLGTQTSLHLKMHYSPFSYLSNDDIHHLRADLQQSPSFSMSGFGQALDLQVDWRYEWQDWGQLSLGYRYWERKVTDGNWYAYGLSGTSTAPLVEMRTTRQGLNLGLHVLF
ncbi:MAG: hypothetical protein R6X06_05715 [Gammaproteobacteria bacterium]